MWNDEYTKFTPTFSLGKGTSVERIGTEEFGAD